MTKIQKLFDNQTKKYFLIGNLKTVHLYGTLKIYKRFNSTVCKPIFCYSSLINCLLHRNPLKTKDKLTFSAHILCLILFRLLYITKT